MEKKLTNSGPLRESADKHSIYPHFMLFAECKSIKNREIYRILWVMNPVKLASIACAAHTAHAPSTRDACS